MAQLHLLPAFEGDTLRAVIEASAGTRTKFKWQPAVGCLEASHVLPPGMAFPLDFGFIPGTKGGDGDPLDVLVMADESMPVGVLVKCRLIGVIEAEQADGRAKLRNDRHLAVALASREYAGIRNIGDVPRKLLDSVECFFVAYNAQRGREFRPMARRGRTAARRLVESSMQPQR